MTLRSVNIALGEEVTITWMGQYRIADDHEVLPTEGTPEELKELWDAAYQKVEAARKQSELMEKQTAIMQQRYDGGLVNQSILLEVALGVELVLGWAHGPFTF